MKTLKNEELRSLEIGTLQEKLKEIKDGLFQLKLDQSMGKLENPMSLRIARRDIARIQTIITEKVKGIR